MNDDNAERMRYLARTSADMTAELARLVETEPIAADDLKRVMALANAVRTATWNLVRAAHEELIDSGDG